MRLTLAQQHCVQLKDGKNRCTKCGKVEPDLTKPCSKVLKPAGTVRK